ncbi:MAG: IS110 family transposase [Acholeplasmatales bacterium]|nr:IS110 family transposase [Acholeplasmatales bacterium]
MTKTGNSYLRYYLCEAASMTVLHNPVYKTRYTNQKRIYYFLYN